MINFPNIPKNNIELKSGLQILNFESAELALDYQCAHNNPTHLLILVNGYQRNRLDFRAMRNKLEKRVPQLATVALDNRYCGETKVSENSPFSINVMAQDVLAIASIFMQKLNLKQFSLLGLSMGGMIAQTLASQLLQGILDNLFLVSTTAGGSGRTWIKENINPKMLKYENKNVDLESTKKNMSRYFADKFLKESPLLFEMMCKSMLKIPQNSMEDHNNAGSKQFYASLNFDGTSTLNKISANKTIIFSGDSDKIIPLENSHYLNQHIQNSELIVYPDVGHLILIEAPNEFAQNLASFFEGHS